MQGEANKNGGGGGGGGEGRWGSIAVREKVGGGFMTCNSGVQSHTIV